MVLNWFREDSPDESQHSAADVLPKDAVLSLIPFARHISFFLISFRFFLTLFPFSVFVGLPHQQLGSRDTVCPRNLGTGQGNDDDEWISCDSGTVRFPAPGSIQTFKVQVFRTNRCVLGRRVSKRACFVRISRPSTDNSESRLVPFRLFCPRRAGSSSANWSPVPGHVSPISHHEGEKGYLPIVTALNPAT